MNKIIKFRAWHKGLKCMSEVLELDFQHDAIRCVPGHLPKNRISDCELMQFTELLDKHGKEIYELMEIDNRYRVIYNAPEYVLQDISNGDIIPLYEKCEITGEYSPLP